MSKLSKFSTRPRQDVVFLSPTQIALRKIKLALIELYQEPLFQQQLHRTFAMLCCSVLSFVIAYLFIKGSV